VKDAEEIDDEFRSERKAQNHLIPAKDLLRASVMIDDL
jgi:hypothetical protein